MRRLKELWDAVDSAQKGWAGVAAVVSFVLPTVGVRSQKMTLVFEIAVFAGLVLGYLFTVSRWAGEGKARCLRRRKVYLSIVWIPLLLIIAMLVILEPDLAIALSAQNIHGLLVSSSTLPNLFAFAGGFYGTYLLIGAIVLSSPKVWRRRS